jgi:hypothetical protein
MKNIYIIKRFESGRLLVAIDYGSIRIITQQQYNDFIKMYPQ